MNRLFKKSATSLISSKQTLTALISIDVLRAFSSVTPSQSFNSHSDFALIEKKNIPSPSNGFSGIRGIRGIHFSSGPLGYKAEARFDDFSDEEKTLKGSGGDEGLEISKLGIDQSMVNALAGKGITKLFPIQKAVLDPAMQGRDMIGRARTGTGKTLAFGIPILDKITSYNNAHGKGRNPLAIVLAPTRELAKQVDKEFRECAPHLDALCCYGGVPKYTQTQQLNYGVDVVVGTPGRIIDLCETRALDLSEVQFAVLDEADQMLAVGFEEDVEKILQKLPQKRQTMMFSATMPQWIRQLSRKYLRDALIIDLVGDSDKKLAEGISLYAIQADKFGKAGILGPLIKDHAKGGKCIVFTQTKRDADRLSYALQRSLNCEPLHGDISQGQREKTLSGFRDGRFNVLVATDVAARGLDVPNVDLIIHYDSPSSSEIFVHRSGRTGRAGKKGTAILIYTDDQIRIVRGIEKDVGSTFSELPRIAAEPGLDMHGDGGGRFSSSFGSRGGTGGGFGRSGGFGRPSGYGNSSSSSRPGGYSESGGGRFGSYGGQSSGRSGGGFGSYGGQSSGRSGGGFGSSSPSQSGGSGFGRSGGGSDRSSGGFGSNRYGGSSSSPFGDFE